MNDLNNAIAVIDNLGASATIKVAKPPNNFIIEQEEEIYNLYISDYGYNIYHDKYTLDISTELANFIIELQDVKLDYTKLEIKHDYTFKLLINNTSLGTPVFIEEVISVKASTLNSAIRMILNTYNDKYNYLISIESLLD